MNKLTNTIVATCFTLGTYSVFTAFAIAAESSNTKDAKEGLVQDQTTDYKKMDTNADGMISKNEYMMHHEQSYAKMKQSNGGVSFKDMDAYNSAGTKGNKIQPNSAKDAPPEARN